MEKGNFPRRCCISFFIEEKEIRESNLKVPLMDAGLKNRETGEQSKIWLVNETVSRFTTRNQL